MSEIPFGFNPATVVNDGTAVIESCLLKDSDRSYIARTERALAIIGSLG